MRFHRMKANCGEGKPCRIVVVKMPNRPPVEVEVDEPVFEALVDLQRELWRLDRREARHSAHMDNMLDKPIFHARHVKTPDQVLVEQMEADEIRKAIRKIPCIQKRRFLLRHLAGLSCRQIANMDGCSIRAVEQSLALARKNLRRILKGVV